MACKPKVKKDELPEIIIKFAESGWDVLEKPSQDWLEAQNDETKAKLIEAVKAADAECGQCGCEFDPLYKKALELLAK